MKTNWQEQTLLKHEHQTTSIVLNRYCKCFEFVHKTIRFLATLYSFLYEYTYKQAVITEHWLVIPSKRLRSRISSICDRHFCLDMIVIVGTLSLTDIRQSSDKFMAWIINYIHTKLFNCVLVWQSLMLGHGLVITSTYSYGCNHLSMP